MTHRRGLEITDKGLSPFQRSEGKGKERKGKERKGKEKMVEISLKFCRINFSH